jgi:hypothetical protein
MQRGGLTQPLAPNHQLVAVLHSVTPVHKNIKITCTWYPRFFLNFTVINRILQSIGVVSKMVRALQYRYYTSTS